MLGLSTKAPKLAILIAKACGDLLQNRFLPNKTHARCWETCTRRAETNFLRRITDKEQDSRTSQMACDRIGGTVGPWLKRFASVVVKTNNLPQTGGLGGIRMPLQRKQ